MFTLPDPVLGVDQTEWSAIVGGFSSGTGGFGAVCPVQCERQSRSLRKRGRG